MHLLLRFFLVTVALAVTTVACSSVAPQTVPINPSPPVEETQSSDSAHGDGPRGGIMELNSEDANTDQKVSVGDTIIVRLEETPTTGYQWRPDVDAGALRLVNDYYDVAQAPRGASGVHTFEFRALREGSTVLKLLQSRLWADHTIDEYQVTLDVTQ